MPFDKWTIIDIVTAFMNLICFNTIGNITPSQILDPSQKQTFDYYVIVVIMLSWIRFFSYFLVVKSVSKLLMIIFNIFIKIMTFNFVLFSIVLIGMCLF